MKMRLYLMLFLLPFAFSCSVSKIGWKDLEDKKSIIRSFTYLKEEGSNRSIYYFLPEKSSRGKIPAIIFFHGGAWTGGAASTFFSHAAYYAQHGIASFSVDYRLLNTDANDILDCIQDCQKAVSAICEKAEKLGVDTTQLIFCGESAGGHLASAVYLNYKKPQHIKALVLLNPVLDLSTPIFLPYMDRSLVGKSAKKLSLDSMMLLYGKKARELSPLQYVSKFISPLLIINGDADKITPIETAQLFFDNHPNQKNISSFVRLNKTGHAFSIPHYKSPEAVVVETIHTMDLFLKKLKIFQGRTTIGVKDYSDWLPAKPSK